MKGILLVDKARGNTSFSLIRKLRAITNISKIGHAGTLDPLATGVMIYLVGKEFTQKSNQFIHLDKEYLAEIKLGITTNTYDMEGEIASTSNFIPEKAQLLSVLDTFQGTIDQIPPMFSAKKVNGKKLYEYARKNQEIKRDAQQIHVCIEFESYEYPYLKIKVQCSKGTYIRSLAHDIGQKLTCGATLFSLVRTRIGPYHLKDCIAEKELTLEKIQNHLF